LFNTGVSTNGALLVNATVDPHYRLVQSADPAAPGPSVFVVTDTLYPINGGPWLVSGPNSKWIGPQANQSTGNLPGDYKFRIVFDLTGLDSITAVVTVRCTSDNAISGIYLNDQHTGLTYDGNFRVLSPVFSIVAGFVDGTNVLDFVVNNAGAAASPIGFRAEISGTADALPPPGTPPSVVTPPASQSVVLGEGVTFNVRATGARPLSYQWRFNGMNIANATNAAYTIPGVSNNDVGSYDVVVSNAWGSVPSAAANLAITHPSPAQLSYEPLGPSSRRTGLTFSEIMYHPTNRTDARNLEFIELYNSNPFFEDISGWRLDGAVDYTFPSNTVIQGNGFVVIAPAPADVEAVYGIAGVLGGFTNSLPNSGGTLRLRKRSDAIVLEVNYSDQTPWPIAADGAGHSLVLARPSHGENNSEAWAASAWKGGSPGAPDPVPENSYDHVVINEWFANVYPTNAAEFIELYNHSELAVDLSGFWLSDDPATNKFRIPDGTTILPNRHLVFKGDQFGFGLSSLGERIFVVNSNNTRVVDAVRYPAQARGVSTGRTPDGAPTFTDLMSDTPGSRNTGPRLPGSDAARLRHDQIVINEIMYNPLAGSDGEFIELHNPGTNAVNAGGYRVDGGVQFIIPSNTVIAASGYLVITKNHDWMLTHYPSLDPAVVVGNYSGRLNNRGDRVTLLFPEPDFWLMDEVVYKDGGRWGQWSDGGGSSLELIDPHSDNRLASNWADSDETDKAGWTLVENTGTLDLGHSSQSGADQLQVMLQGKGEALLDDVEVLVSGANRIANGSFEADAAGWFFQGTHRLSSLDLNGGFNSAHSLHLRATERGDHVANRVRTPLSGGNIPSGTTNVTIRAKVRWLAGHPEILLRFKGGFLEAVGRLNVPLNGGTPGSRNSRWRPNAGPAVTDVSHRPVLPQPDLNIRVTARVADPDGLQSVILGYRLGPSATLNLVPMIDNGTGGDLLADDGIYTGTIPGQTNGALIAFHIEATDGFIVPATTFFPADSLTRECLIRVGDVMPTNTFGTYRFWITQASHNFWAAREKMSNEDVDATFVYGTNRVVYNAGARYSGSSYAAPLYTTPSGAFCGYDIDFPGDDSMLGETHFTLDWPVRDDTDQREQLMFWFLEQYGLPNMYRRYVNLYVNGAKRGTIYDDVQQPGGDTIEEWFPTDSEGNLYKTDCWNEFDDNGNRIDPCYLNTLDVFVSGGMKKVARYRWNWRPRAIHGTANDFDDLFNLVDAANAPGGGYQSAIECFVDMEHWMRTFAMNDLASFWDAFGNPNAKNTYLYKPERAGWKLVCWDFDLGLGVFNDPVNDPLFPSNVDTNVIRMYNFPAFVRLYWNALDEAVNGFFQTGPGKPIDALLDAKYAAFQANNIKLASPAAIKTWIAQRRDFLLTQLNTVSNVFSVAAPDMFSMNRNLVALTGTAPVRVRSLSVNGVVQPVNWLTPTHWRLLVPLDPGTNVLYVAGLDRFGNPVSDASRVITIENTASTELPQDDLVISEIMYNPLVPEATYVELFNRSFSASFDLSGWRLNGIDFTFPQGTLITNRGFLVITKNRAAFGTAYGWGIPVLCEFDGQLDDGGETLSLIKPGATAAQDVIVDVVTYDDDPPWPGAPDGQGASLQVIDVNQDNNRVSNWSEGFGWRFATFTGNPGGTPGSQLSFFPASSATDVYLDDVSFVSGSVPETGVNLVANGSFESGSNFWFITGLASNSTIVSNVAHSGRQSLHLVFAPGTPTPTAFYQILTNVLPQGVTPNTTNTVSFWFLPGTNSSAIQVRLNLLFRSIVDIRPSRVTPGAPNVPSAILPPYPLLWLSELQPDNVSTIADNAGEFDPWLELYNSGGEMLSLDGFFLANNYTNLTQWAFPSGTTIAPGQFLLVWADAEPAQTAGTNLHSNFRLEADGGSIALSRDLNGTPQLLDYINYGELGTNRSFGSFPDGQLSFRQPFYFATPRSGNDPSAPPVTLFINEWMAANQNFLADPADQDFDDWFEIYNPTTNRVDLGGFRLTDDFTNPNKFVIPASISIPPHGFLLVWADEEGGQNGPGRELHVNFKLSQRGENIGLYDPAGRPVDTLLFGMQTNNVSEGRWPDGAAERYFMTLPTPRGPNIIPASAPILHLSIGPSNLVTLAWPAQPGRSYRVQFKDDLDAAAWSDLAGDVTATGPSASRTDSLTNTQRFYQVVLLQ
jgi:hypothetical protein